MLRWFLPALLSAIAALLACFPLSWAAGWVLPENIKTLAPDLTLHGTIWQGTASGLPLFEAANVKVDPKSRQIYFQSGGEGNYFAGQASQSEAKNIDFRMNFATVPFTDGRLQGLRGHFNISISEMKLSGQSCKSATGTAKSDVLQRNGGTIQWTGPALAGPIRCEDGALIADLSGQDAQQKISALIRILPQGTYRADIDVRTARSEAGLVLPLFGFSRSGQSFVLTEQGKWR